MHTFKGSYSGIIDLVLGSVYLNKSTNLYRNLGFVSVYFGVEYALGVLALSVTCI